MSLRCHHLSAVYLTEPWQSFTRAWGKYSYVLRVHRHGWYNICDMILFVLSLYRFVSALLFCLYFLVAQLSPSDQHVLWFHRWVSNGGGRCPWLKQRTNSRVTVYTIQSVFALVFLFTAAAKVICGGKHRSVPRCLTCACVCSSSRHECLLTPSTL